ncbi:MAG: DUF3147 family protein [Deltaproteobacteria bacterium]|nr:DUF3147 family protein [Deltaproteobacteria bacterium]
MRIQISPSPLFKTRWYEYATRFVLGGLITVCAGLIAEKWGPSVGGLFLAFPAIFPASATLIEKHERQSKQAKGLAGDDRAKNAAAIDAAGASIGSIGLLAFAFVGSVFLPDRSAPLVLLFATLAWFLVSVTFWRLRKAM